MNKINSFESFHALILNSKNQHWETNWNVFIQSDFIAFYRLAITENDLKISFRVLIDNDLKVQIYKNNSRASNDECNWLLDDNKLESWSEFNDLLNYYADEPEISVQSSPIECLKVLKFNDHFRIQKLRS